MFSNIYFRDGHGMDMPLVRFRTPLGPGFSEKYYISPLSILGHCVDVVSLGKANVIQNVLCLFNSPGRRQLSMKPQRS